MGKAICHWARRATLIAALLLPGAALADQADAIRFDVILHGIKAGELRIDGQIEGARYAAQGVMETTGLAAALRKIRYTATTQGAMRETRFTPARYTETAERGNGTRRDFEIRYRAGTPVSVASNPPRTPKDRDVDPAKQGGTIDPLTALYAVLRDVAPDQACRLDVKMFDGARRSQVQLSAPRPKGKGVTCAGEYRRLEGFSAREMAEKSRFPFTLTYAPTEDGRLRVVEISTETILGKGHLKRR